MTALLVRHQHSRFQLRRTTLPTSVLGALVLSVGLVALMLSLGSSSVVEGLVGVAIGFLGVKLILSGALLLETDGGGCFVASVNKTLTSAEVGEVIVRWRLNFDREKEVEVELSSPGVRLDVSQGWLEYSDPDELAKLLGGQLRVPFRVEDAPPPIGG